MASGWTLLRAAVDPIARRYNLYTAYRVGWEERIGDVDGMGADAARWYLQDRGYEPQYLSAAKAWPDAGRPWGDGDLHDLSYRRVPDRHPPRAYGKPLEEWRPADCQYHVHVFVRDGGAVFFSHYELRPDFFSPAFSPARLRAHYRPAYGQSYLRGVTDLEL